MEHIDNLLNPDLLHYIIFGLIISLFLLFFWIYLGIKKVSKQNQQLFNECQKVHEQLDKNNKKSCECKNSK